MQENVLNEIELTVKIPTNWEVKRVKDVIEKIGNGITPQGGSENYTETGIPFLRSQNVYDDGLRLKGVAFIPREIHEQMQISQIRPLDILFNITGASIGRTCIVPSDFREGNINQHVCFLRVKKNFNPYYISLFLKSQLVKDHIQREQNGASKEAFTLPQVANIKLLLPPQNEQKAIINYLKIKTSHIDQRIRLLSKKAKKYSTLQQALISETITQGLNNSPKLKDSGIEWIGKVPEHWEIARTKDLFIESKNKVGEYSYKYKVLSLTLDGIIERNMEESKGKFPASFDGYQIIEPGTLLLCLFDIDVTPRIIGYVDQIGITTSSV